MNKKMLGMGLATMIGVGVTGHTTAAHAADIEMKYGEPHNATIELRVFYVITPSTQLNEASIGVVTFQAIDHLGLGRSSIQFNSAGWNTASVLGTCTRTGRSQITTDCFNRVTGNAIACRGLTAVTGWTKPGAGHAIDNVNHVDMRNAILDVLKSATMLRSSVDSLPTESWVAPGTHSHIVSIFQPGGRSTVYKVSNDNDKDGYFCLYDVTWGRS